MNRSSLYMPKLCIALAIKQAMCFWENIWKIAKKLATMLPVTFFHLETVKTPSVESVSGLLSLKHSFL